MRVRGDNNPGTISIEAIPNKPGWCLVRFYENAQEYTEQLDETTITGWEYDEYHLEQPTISQEDIEGNLEVYLRGGEGGRGHPREPSGGCGAKQGRQAGGRRSMGQHGGGVPGRGAERMTTKDLVLSIMRSQGAADALDLRSRASDLDGTAIIAEESKTPVFDPEKDYSGWPIGAPVRDGEQLYKLLQPYNASTWPDQRPADLPALWSICHTKDPSKAKEWLAPNGTSGMYMSGECCVDGGVVYRCLTDNTVHSPTDYPQAWERV